MAQASQSDDIYFVPEPSFWPIVGTIGLFLLAGGFASYLNGVEFGPWICLLGALFLITMLFGWFGAVIRESLSGLYNAQVDRTFRWAMGWFIFSEVMFFAAFFGALFHGRFASVPVLSGEAARDVTHYLLWPNYEGGWPTNGPAKIGGAFESVKAWGLPAINTAILLTSSWTVTLAHHAVKEGKNRLCSAWLLVTVLLGILFLYFQAVEYHEAYTELNLTLHSGIFGSTFFMLTGFHGAHVTLGTIMLTVIFLRSLRNHFTPEHHFAFEAVAWYWHFVDVVWLGLFIFVYIL